MAKALRPDAPQLLELIQQRRFFSLWHFTRLVCVPCIVYHQALFSIQELERREMTVPPRPSREDDILKGVGDFVKLSTMPYWDMLSRLLREGESHVLIEFTTDPILLDSTRFGDRNVWDNGWMMDGTLDFARDHVLVRKPAWTGGSPPEIYVRRTLALVPYARRVLTYIREDNEMLMDCLTRLNIGVAGVKIAHNGPQRPFPDQCHDGHREARGQRIGRVREYLRRVTIESLRRGVEMDP